MPEPSEKKLGHYTGSEVLRKLCLEYADKYNLVVLEDRSNFDTRNSVIWYTCLNINQFGEICNNTHPKTIRAFLQHQKPWCCSCGVGRGTSRKSMRNPEEQERQKKLLAKKAIVRVEAASDMTPSDYEPLFLDDNNEKDPIKRQQRSANIFDWKLVIQTRYNFRSFLSGLTKKESKLHCHHIVPVNVAPYLKFDINNGVLITEEEHILFHSTYGHGARAAFFFEKWVTDNYGIDPVDFPWRSPTSREEIALALRSIEDKHIAQAKKLLALVKERNHETLNFDMHLYKSVREQVLLRCKTHNVKQQIKWHAYVRQKKTRALRCCSGDYTTKKIAQCFSGSPLIIRFMPADCLFFEIYLDTFEETGQYTCLHKKVTFSDFFKKPNYYLEVPKT